MKRIELVPMPGIELAREDYNTSLQYQRNLKRLTQSRLAELSGIPVRTIQHWECGQRDINGASLYRLCDLAHALNCKIYDILDDEKLIKKLKMVIS